MPGRIPPEIIETLRARIDIVELIQSYIPLKRAGRDFKACCPFHQEKTPSFVVSQQRQHYHCFGCGKHGSAITFVMERENVDFPDAVRLLARKYNIYIPEDEKPRYGSRYRQTPDDDYESHGSWQSRKDRLFDLHEKLCRFYRENLVKNPESAVAQYLATRKLAPESIEQFMLGASPDSWDSTLRFAKANGFTEDELSEGGIIKVSDDGVKKYDMFRNRLMFPIWDEMGRVVGFSARTIESDPKMMKYVNTPETPIFKKKKILYGMHIARAEMGSNKFGFAILCEGQLDVIAMHAAGFPNSIAAEGTAFTVEQASMLKRYTDCVRLGLDSDRAGTMAIFKDARILLPKGFEIKVIQYPGGKDPDELLKNSGREAIAEAVDKSEDFFEFALRKNQEENGDTPGGKVKTVETMLEFIALLGSETAKSAYSDWVAQRVGLSGDALYAQLDKISQKIQADEERMARYEQARQERENAQNPQPRKRPLTPAEKQLHKALFELLQCMLGNNRIAERASNEITREMMDESHYAAAVESVIECSMLGELEEAPARLVQTIGELEDLEKDLSELLISDFPEIEDRMADQIYASCSRILKMNASEIEYQKLLEQLRLLPPDSPERQNIMMKLSENSRNRSKF